MHTLRSLALGALALGTLAACDSAMDPATDSDPASGVPPRLVEADGVVGDRYRPATASFLPGADAASAQAPLAFTAGYQVEAPEGTSATHLSLRAGGVTASYLEVGVAFGGGIDLIDELDPAASATLVSDYVDLAGVEYVGTDMVVSGSLDIENEDITGFGSKAVFARLNALGVPTAAADLSSDFVMDAAFPAGDAFYVVTGIEGDVYAIDKAAFTATSLAQIDDLRSVAVSGDALFALDGDGNVYRHDLASPDAFDTDPAATVGAFGAGTIAKMVADDGKLYVPNGTAGFTVLDAADASVLGSIDTGAVKSFAFGGGYAFVANADGGVLVAEWGTDDLGEPALLDAGRILFEDIDGNAGQVNHVAVSGSTLYAAAGDLGVFSVTFAEADAD